MQVKDMTKGNELKLIFLFSLPVRKQEELRLQLLPLRKQSFQLQVR